MINDDNEKARNEELMADSATYQYEDEAIDVDMNGAPNGQPYTAGSGSFSDIDTQEISGVASKFRGKADEIAERYGGSVAWVGLASAVLLLQSIVVSVSGFDRSCPRVVGIQTRTGQRLLDGHMYIYMVVADYLFCGDWSD
jgi:hypothetical protein